MKWWYWLILEVLIIFGVIVWIFFFPSEIEYDFAKGLFGFVLINGIEECRNINRRKVMDYKEGMTEEELATEWVEKEYDELRYEKCERKDFIFTYYELKEMGKQAFLAGLKAKTQWHDLRKNPDDLPEERGNYILCFIGAKGSNRAGKICETIAFFDPEYMEWSKEDNEEEIPYFRNKKVLIAWCEIPTFKE